MGLLGRGVILGYLLFPENLILEEDIQGSALHIRWFCSWVYFGRRLKKGHDGGWGLMVPVLSLSDRECPLSTGYCQPWTASFFLGSHSYLYPEPCWPGQKYTVAANTSRLLLVLSGFPNLLFFWTFENSASVSKISLNNLNLTMPSVSHRDLDCLRVFTFEALKMCMLN